MSAPAAPPPAPPNPPPAPAPGAPAAAPAAPAAPAQPERGADDPQLKSIFDDLGIVLQTPSPAAPAPAPAAGAPPGSPPPAAPSPAGTPPAQPTGTAPAGGTVPPAGTPPPAAPPGTPVVRREKPIAQVVEDVVRKVFGEAQPQTPAAPTPGTPQTPPVAPPAAPDDPFLATLVPEEKETYELAKWAEENVPEFKDRKVAAEFLNFYKAVDGYITAETAKDPTRKFDDDDEAFQSFLEAKRPDIEPAKWEKLKTERLVAQVEERTERKLTEKFSRENEEISHRQLVLEKKPVIEGRLRGFQDNIGKLMTADPNSIQATIAKTIEKDGLEKAFEADPIFTPLVVKAYNEGEQAAAEFLAMAHGLKRYDTADPNHPVQDWVIRFIRRAGEVFAVKGGDKLNRQEADGTVKTFLPRGKFNELKQRDPAQAGRHWTFSDEDVVMMLERNTADHIAAMVKAENDKLQKGGYVRPAVQQTPNPVSPGAPAPAPNGHTAPSPAPQPQPIGSPRAGVTAAPGQGGGTVAQQTAMSDAELQLLGVKKAA